MDTSKEYVKMCDCPEVQGKWEPRNNARQRGDTYWVKPHDEGLDGHLKEFAHNFVGLPWADYIFLPRQDQIMAMCFDKTWGLQTILYRLKEFSTMDPGISITVSGTMEQLLLAFYMFTEHDKEWWGEKWQ